MPLEDCGGGGGGGGSGPGNGHPDDNLSAASAQLPPVEFPPGVRDEIRVGVLRRGFVESARAFAEQAGERTWPVSLNFEPVATVEQFPVLIIPSGGLFGLENSPSFRARLEEYARLGGVIVAFSQQHGYEYGALPGGGSPPPGLGEGPGGGAYGWTEDFSCFDASLYISEWHPALSGFDRATLDAHVDGYFTHWPTGTHTLLSRTANGQPAAILYPYPSSPPLGGTEGGWVFATTIYDDWGTGRGQSSQDARILLRDLLTWAILPPGGGEPEGGLPQFTPGTVSLTVPVTNTTPYTATAASLRLVDPARRVILTRTIPITIPAGAVATVPFTTTATAPLGIWRIDATLLTANGSRLTANTQVARFIVASPATPVDPARDLSLSITAPDDHFVPGSVAPFTFHVYNHTGSERTATVRYGMPHHTWESRDRATYGLFRDHSRTLSVPPHDQATFTWQVPVFTRDTVWGRLQQNGARAWFDVFRARASASVRVATGEATYVRGQPVTVTLTAINSSRGPLTGTLELRVSDARNRLLHADFLPLALPAGGQAVLSDTFTVPVAASDGSALIAAYVRDSTGKVVGGGHATFDVPASPLVFAATLPETLVPGASQAITIAAVNASPILPDHSRHHLHRHPHRRPFDRLRAGPHPHPHPRRRLR